MGAQSLPDATFMYFKDKSRKLWVFACNILYLYDTYMYFAQVFISEYKVYPKKFILRIDPVIRGILNVTYKR